MRIAILDDYLDVARTCADWDSLADVQQITVFDEHLGFDIDQLAEALQPFDVISAMRERTSFPAELLERLPNLRLLVTTGMNNASIDVAAATQAGVLVCGTNGVSTPAPELTWGLLLAVTRGIPSENRTIREGRWQTRLGEGLHGKRLGILGLGQIGAKIATYATAFGMDVVAWSANLSQERADEVGVELVSKETLLSTADAITIHLRLGERTAGLIGKRELDLMKPTAFLINTSRGPIVDEGALVDALRDRRIAGAGLDVFDVEPIPADHPMLGLDNVVLTPHIGYVTRETFEVFYGGTVETIAAFQAGDPIRMFNPEVRA